jgi:acetyltransferase-like isoleucine patch superfamily enzyme
MLADVADLSEYDIGEWTHGHLTVKHRFQRQLTLKIGRFCSLAPGTTVVLGGEHRTDWVTSYSFTLLFAEAADIPCGLKLKGDVVIGNDVWIGQDAMIMSGVRIGDGAVIGARSVVRTDVPPYAVAAGNPARVTGFRFDKETIRQLIDIAWWDWPIEKIKEAFPLLLSDNVAAFIERYGK